VQPLCELGVVVFGNRLWHRLCLWNRVLTQLHKGGTQLLSSVLMGSPYPGVSRMREVVPGSTSGLSPRRVMNGVVLVIVHSLRPVVIHFYSSHRPRLRIIVVEIIVFRCRRYLRPKTVGSDRTKFPLFPFPRSAFLLGRRIVGVQTILARWNSNLAALLLLVALNGLGRTILCLGLARFLSCCGNLVVVLDCIADTGRATNGRRLRARALFR